MIPKSNEYRENFNDWEKSDLNMRVNRNVWDQLKIFSINGIFFVEYTGSLKPLNAETSTDLTLGAKMMIYNYD